MKALERESRLGVWMGERKRGDGSFFAEDENAMQLYHGCLWVQRADPF